MQAIIIGTEDPIKYENEMLKLPGIVKLESELHFSTGPNLKLIRSETPFLALQIKVESIDKARLALEILDLATRITDQGIEIIDELLPIKITLFD